MSFLLDAGKELDLLLNRPVLFKIKNNSYSLSLKAKDLLEFIRVSLDKDSQELYRFFKNKYKGWFNMKDEKLEEELIKSLLIEYETSINFMFPKEEKINSNNKTLSKSKSYLEISSYLFSISKYLNKSLEEILNMSIKHIYLINKLLEKEIKEEKKKNMKWV